MHYDFLKIRIENRIGWIEFNRPPINAFNWEMSGEVLEAFEELLKSSQVRVIVFASALGKHFSVGADLHEFKTCSQEEMKKWVVHFHSLVRKMRQSDKPLLAAIHGTAVGAGLEITLHCDVRFASETTQFGQPEINIAI